MENKPIRKTEANSREIHAIEFIAGLDNRLAKDGKYLENRLRSVPDLWRQYRIAKTATEKVIDGLYETLEPKVLARLTRLCTFGEVYFRYESPVNKATDAQLVLDKDIDVLVNTAMSSTCAFCMKTGTEIKECELRRSLMNIAPPTVLFEGSSLCEYAAVAHDNELGDYI